MEKSPLKKMRMMDIVRKKPSVVPIVRKEKTETPVEPMEEQVKFTVEKKPSPQDVQAFIDDREARRAQKEEMREEVVKESTPSQQRAETAHLYHPEDKEHHSAEVDVEPRILEAHAGHEQSRMAPEESPERSRREEERSHESDRMIPEVSSIEIDRPIAYIPKEKPSREEKKVLERIERRERSFEREGGKKKKGALVWVISCLLLGVGAYLVVAVLPRAEISLVPKTFQFAWSNTISASTKIAEIDPVNKQIPVAVFPGKKTNAFSFPATGSGKSIERKAIGKATIYNNFSGAQQPLVAGTRLETPDGKIFKLKDRVIVPGATTVGGKLAAASIEADVIADKAGEAYNISPVSKFTIPGFKGTTKYDGFYGESKDPMTGGFIGEGKYPTADDIKAGKESAEKQMKEVIEAGLVVGGDIPEGFKVIESGKKFTITKEVVIEAVDDQGNFSIYIEAEEPTAALKEDHVLNLMTALAQQANNGEGYEIKEHTLSYGAISVDEKSGAISLPIEFNGVFWKPINMDEFKTNVVGKKENELKSYIISSTNIDKADVALWPFWVKTVPNDPSRVKVELK